GRVRAGGEDDQASQGRRGLPERSVVRGGRAAVEPDAAEAPAVVSRGGVGVAAARVAEAGGEEEGPGRVGGPRSEPRRHPQLRRPRTGRRVPEQHALLPPRLLGGSDGSHPQESDSER
ncbi:unnamed protein product, partial [Ectocarpus sp. 12 AP-2014]